MYNCFGCIISLEGETEKIIKTSIKHFEKARILVSLLGMKDEMKELEHQLTKRRFSLAHTYVCERITAATDPFDIVKYDYEYSLKLHGLTSEKTLRNGLWFANALVQRHHGIEAQRLVAKDGDQQSLCSWSRTQLHFNC